MPTRPWVLGLSCSHNGSACLLHGDEIVAAVQDERLLRLKRRRTKARFVEYCVRYCLEAAGIGPEQLDGVVYSITRGAGPHDHDDIFLNDYLRVGSRHLSVLDIPHHLAHAISAFATSGTRDATVLVIDGSGTRFDRLPPHEQEAARPRGITPEACEWLTWYDAHDTTLRPVFKQMAVPFRNDARGVSPFGSLGDMYGAIGALLFSSYFDGPGKVMGLAPYGTPSIGIEQWVSVDDAGLVRFHEEGYREARRRHDELAHPSCSGDVEWRNGRSRAFQTDADIAASVQQALEHALLKIVARIRHESDSRTLCYAGGVALNSVANERLVREGGFEDVFIFPAAEDSGVAVGAAFHGLWQLMGTNTARRLSRDAMGRQYREDEIARAIRSTPAIHVRRSSDVAADVAELLCAGNIVGWFSGRSELGPRALGSRSVLCDPRAPDAKDILNRRVKRREPFRPFAPVVLKEHVHGWFHVPAQADSPFMLRVWPFLPGKGALVPAVAHVDDTARVQTVERETCPALHALISAFHARTGVPMLLNTSFNIAGEPIIERPEDALWSLLCTGLDCCVIEDRIVHRRAGFDTILDLCPRVTARTVAIDVSVSAGRFSLDLTGGAPRRDQPDIEPLEPANFAQYASHLRASGSCVPLASATAETPWGDSTILLTADHLELLKLSDGRTSGRRLVHHRPGWSEAWLAQAFSGLYRTSLITFAT
jgi:carbamoyltransferase